MKNKFSLLVKAAAAVLTLALLTCQYSEFLTFAAESTQYVESVCMFTAPTKDEAVKKCKNSGYIPVEGDMNEGSGSSSVVLGYTVTTNPYEALTDMTVLEMNTGYETVNYSYILEKQMAQSSKITDSLMASVSAYSKNLRAESPAAKEANEILNLLYIPGEDNASLGDYLASDDCNEDFLKKLVCRANSGITLAIVNTMAAGVADFGEANWVERLVTSNIPLLLTADDYDYQLDREYEKMAKELRQPLHDFSEYVSKALDFVGKYGYEALKDKADEGAGKYEMPEGVMDSIMECEDLEDRDKYVMYLMAYEILNSYTFNDGTGAGDYLCSLGSSDYTSVEDVRKIYPLAGSLAAGQFGVMRIVGIPQMALSLINDEKLIEETYKYTDKLRKDIAAFNKDGSDRLSVWAGVDLIPYTSEIALTYQGVRSTQAGKEFSDLVSETQKNKDLNYLMTSFSIGATIIDSAVIIATIGVNAYQIYNLGFFGWATAEGASLWALCYHAATAAGTGTIATILGYMGVVMVIGMWVMTAFTLLVLAYMLIDSIIEYFTDEEDTLEYTADDIPLYVYDYRNSIYSRYDAVKDENGNPADLNGNIGRRFAALYSTKQEGAGEPIKVNPAGNTFRLVKNDSLAPSGYESVRYFGPGAPANLNSYSRNKTAPQIYLSYYSNETAKINEGETSEVTDSKPEYLESLYVAAEKTETAAKDKLKKMGYYPIDKNLSGFYGKKNGLYTYLGYKTTTIKDEAVTDIRVVPQGIGVGDSLSYGASTYVRAGEDIPSSIPSIYYCTSSYAGTPIYSDLQVVSSKKSAAEGFEPVNLFCGGDAYNLNATGDSEYCPASLSYANWSSEECVYMYFHPSVTFTSGETYVGGLAFFTGKNTTAKDGDEIQKYAKSNGFKTFDKNFGEDYDIEFEIVRHIGKGKVSSDMVIDDLVTYLGYSETHNPYRAVYSVKSYTALSDKVSALEESLVLGSLNVTGENDEVKTVSKSYAACNVFYQYCGRIQKDDVKLSSFYRGILTSNAWNGITNESAKEILPEISTLPAQSAEDFENYSWKESLPRLKNLYVCGMIPGASPLTPDDIKLVSDLGDEEKMNETGLYCVQDAKTPNRTEAHNIAFSSNHPLYLFTKSEKPHEKKYISSITVTSWNFDATIGSDKGFQKLDKDQQEEYSDKYNGMKDDLCINSAVQSCTDEVILKNLAVPYDKSIQKSFGNVPDEAAYIGVSRTDNVLNAIQSVIKFKPASKSEARTTITVSGTEYIRAGNEPVHDKDGEYYIYYTTNIGCAPNEPITSIDFNDVPIVKDCATALTATETDVQQRVHNGEIVREGRTGELKGCAGETNYIHSKFETSKTHICDIYVGSGNTKNEAMADLLSMGCNAFLDIDLNKGAGGKYVYVGYDRYYDKSGTAKNAVKDVICTVGHKASSEISINGATYKRACDRYLYAGDASQAVSLNEGTNGYSVYLYYTSETGNKPIMELAAGEKDLIPESTDEYVWENVMTTSGKRCNFNDGVFASDDGNNRDTRIYMFAHRSDNSVKDGAGIVCGVTYGIMKYGKLVLK